MKDKLYITKDGLNKLKAELSELRDVKVPEIAKRIKLARDLGDISENAEYDAAKHEQAVIEGKIKELEDIIKHSEIVSDSNGNGEVYVGSKVVVHIEGDEEEFHIVGALEANPIEKKISHESPLGASLLGKKVGDKIDVDAPIGKVTYTILKIE